MIYFNLKERILEYFFGAETRKMALARRENILEDHNPHFLENHSNKLNSTNFAEDISLYFGKWLPNYISTLLLTYAITRQDYLGPLLFTIVSEYGRIKSSNFFFDVIMDEKDVKRYVANKLVDKLKD